MSSRVEIKYSSRLLISLALYRFFNTTKDSILTRERGRVMGLDSVDTTLPMILYFYDFDFPSLSWHRGLFVGYRSTRWLPAISVAMRGERRCRGIQFGNMDSGCWLANIGSWPAGEQHYPERWWIDQKIGWNCCADINVKNYSLMLVQLEIHWKRIDLL